MEVERNAKSSRERDSEATDVLDSFGLGSDFNIFKGMEANLTADTQGGHKVRKTDAAASPESSDRMQAMMITLSKLCLNNSQHIRALRAIVIECGMIPIDGPHAQVLRAATKKHATLKAQLRSEGKDVAFINDLAGPAHVAAWHGIAAATSKRLRDTATTASLEEAASLDAIRQEFLDMGHLKASKIVRHCRLAKENKESKLARFEVTIADDTPRKIMEAVVWKDILSVKGAHSLPNMAPPGGLEERVQSWVDEQSEDTTTRSKGSGRGSTQR